MLGKVLTRVLTNICKVKAKVVHFKLDTTCNNLLILQLTLLSESRCKASTTTLLLGFRIASRVARETQAHNLQFTREQGLLL
jgi:hypothetical protein